MTDTEAPAEAPAAPAAPTPKAKKKSKSSKKDSQSNHPKYREMVKTAITTLKDRGGSSRQAIIKYIAANYNVGDNQKFVNNSVKLALKAGVTAQVFKQTKGVGASGSFKLGTGSKPEKKVKKTKAKTVKPRTPKKSATKPKKAKKAAAKKSPKPKKTTAKKSIKSKKPVAKKPKVKKPAPKKTAKPKKAKK